MQGYNNEFWRNVPRGTSTPYGPASVAQRDCPSVDSTASSGYGSILTPIRRSPAHSFSLEQDYLNSPAFDSWMRDDVSTGPNHMHSFSSSFQNDQLADVTFNDWLTNGIKNSCKLERQVSIPQDKAVCSSVPQVDPEEERREMEQMRALLNEPKPIPPAHYVCHICYEQGHYIQFCPRGDRRQKHTPYQGPKKCFGEFFCPKCKRCWGSANSYSNQTQKCIKCQIAVYPRKQLPVDQALLAGYLKMSENGVPVPVRKNQPWRW